MAATGCSRLDKLCPLSQRGLELRQIVLPYFVATVVVDHDEGATFLMPQHYGYRDGVGLGAFLEGLATYSVLGMRPKT
jgi:hypothetical protein